MIAKFSSLRPYLLAVVAVAAAFAFQLLVGSQFGAVFAFVPFYFAAILAAWGGGLGPALVASVLGALLALLYFITPGTIRVDGKDHLTALVIYFLWSLSSGVMAESLHRARRRVEETRERLRVTLASISDAVLATDAHGNLYAMNPAAEHLTGFSLDEARGRPLDQVLELQDEQSAPRLGAGLGPALPWRPENRTKRTLVTKSGVRVPVEERVSPIYRDAGKLTGFVLVVRDVTEQRRAEDTLRESNERLRLVLQQMPICLSAYDEHGDLIVWNGECERVTGYAAHEVQRNPRLLEMLYPDDEYRQQMVAQLYERRNSYRNWEWRLTTRDGAQRTVAWSNISAQYPIPGWASWALGVDVTERCRTEESLRASEQRFRTMADSAPVLIWISNAQGDCTWFNKPWLDFTGRTMNEELGMGWAENVHPEDRERCLTSFRESLAAHSDFRMEYRLRRHDGQYRWVMDQGIPLHGAGGEFTGFIGSAVDIHERTEAERALREADARKDEFLAMLAHELRNPLATIQYANFITRNVPPEAQDADYSQVIDDQVRHLARLIDDLLDVSRITQNKIELHKSRIEAATIIHQAITSTRPLMESRRHQLEVEISSQPMPLLADPTRLEQVVQNLLNNAAKYTPEEGRIRLSAEPRDGQLVLCVSDNGVGMPSDLIPRVFELFAQGERTLDRSEGGLGIGLTLVNRLVELHGGSVQASSAGPGEGSSFTVLLPLEVDAAASETRNGHALPAGTSPRLKILIVEDNADSARGLALLLNEAGHQTQVCFDGGEVLETARQLVPDVVLLDIGLPGMDGYGVARALREDEHLRRVKILGISGYGQERDRERSRAAGFDHHLVKPVDFATLAVLLAQVAGPGCDDDLPLETASG